MPAIAADTMAAVRGLRTLFTKRSFPMGARCVGNFTYERAWIVKKRVIGLLGTRKDSVKTAASL
jgi:hypothetical protein